MKLGQLELSSSNLVRGSVLFVVCALVLAVRFFVATQHVAICYVQFIGYYSLAVCTMIAVWSFVRICRKHSIWQWSMLKAPLYRHRWGVFAILCLTVLTHVHEPHRFKVLEDEYTLLGTSRMMHEYREASIPGASHYFNGQRYDECRYVGKRALFFQFLLSGMHDVLGYRPENVFILNFLVTIVFYVALYALVFLLVHDRIWAHVALWMAFSVPLLAQVATSAGYGLLSIAMLLIVAVIACSLMRKPNCGLMQTLLIYFSLLATQVRYESLLYLLPMAGIILVVWLRQKKVSISWLDACSPLFLLLPLMLNLNMFSSEKLLDSGVRSGDVSFFGWHHLSGNALDALDYFFVPGIWKTHSTVISVFCLMGFVSIAVMFLSRMRTFFKTENTSNSVLVVGLMSSATFACFLVMLSNFWGQLTDYQASRFALPLYVFGVVCSILMLRELTSLRRHRGKLLLLVMLVASCSSVVSSARSEVTKGMTPSLVARWFLGFAEERGWRDNLYVASGHLGLATHDFACLPNEVLKMDPSSLLRFYAYGIYDKFYALEVYHFNYQSGHYDLDLNNTVISDQLISNVVDELSLKPSVWCRVVEITGLRLEDGREVLFDAYELPSRSYNSRAEHLRATWSIFPDAQPRQLDLAEFGLDLDIKPTAGN